MNKFSPILALLAAAFAAFGFYEHQEAQRIRGFAADKTEETVKLLAQQTTTDLELSKLKEQSQNQKAVIEQLEAHNKELASATPAANSKLEKSADDAKGGGFMKSIAKMFNDPKTRDAMRAQQAIAVKMMYGNLGKELGLAPDVAQQVLAILGDRQADMAAKGMALLTGDKAEKDAAKKETDSTKAAYDDQLKGILGEAGFKKLQDYETTLGDRVALDQIQRQLSAGGTSIEPAQADGLLSIMKEERARLAVALPTSANPADQQKFFEDDATVEKWMGGQQAMNDRVLDRARTLLTPDQLNAFQAAQKQMLDMQQMGVRMSREMFKGK